jgi:hypothetical protein
VEQVQLRRRRQQEQQPQETPEQAARAQAIMDQLLQDILDAESATAVTLPGKHCSCEYGSLPGVWLPGGGGSSAAARWAVLEGDCEVGELLGSEALRQRVADSSQPLQVGAGGAAGAAGWRG